MRKIAVITGTRADYGLLEPLINEIYEDKKLELQLYACGMHLLKKYGNTISEIKYPIKEIVDLNFKNKNTPEDMLYSISTGIKKFAKLFKKNKPDMVVVLGDRIEQLSAAISAHFLAIPLAHTHGGELTYGQFDDATRHAITKLSHIHLPTSINNAKRTRQMGEEAWRIFCTGALGLDSILNKKIISREELFSRYGLNAGKKTFLIVYHPTSLEWNESGKAMGKILHAVSKFDAQKVAIYPNNDAGGNKIINELEKYKSKKDYLIIKNVSHPDYIAFMKHCDVLIGNSSSGIIEAPSLHLPAINIGTRQMGRERASNVIDIYNIDKELKKAIKKALTDKKFIVKVKNCKNPYGNGTASKKIKKILKTIKLGKKLLFKKFEDDN